MFDLITIGSISIDMYFQGVSLTHMGDRFTLAIGGKYLTDHFFEGLGGGAANVAIGAQQMGLSTAILGKIGDNQFKEIIHKHLKDNGVSTSLCHVEKNYMKISSILLSPQGERTIIHYETPHEHILRTEADLQSLENARVVYMSNLGRVSLDERKRILSHVYHKDVLTIMNCGMADCRRPSDQIEALLEHVRILVVNTHEFAELIKKPFEGIDFKKDISRLLPLLQTKVLVVTDGKNGSYAYVNGKVMYEPSHPVAKVVDTTGAGDGFTAGFIVGYLENKNDIPHALHLGNKRGAQIVQKIGAN